MSALKNKHQKYLAAVFFVATIVSFVFQSPWFKDNFKSFSDWGKWTITIVSFVAFALTAFKDQILARLRKDIPEPHHGLSPEKDEEMRIMIDDFNNRHEAKGWMFSVDVLTVKEKWFCMVEPIWPNGKWLRPSLYLEVFEVVWTWRGDVWPDDLVISTNQGVIGDVYHKARTQTAQDVRLFRMDTLHAKTISNFSRRQIEMTDDIRFIACIPIRPIRTRNKISAPINGGMLTLISKSDEVEDIMQDDDLKQYIKEFTFKLAQTYGATFPK
jgi:hypothetical protein